MIPLLAPLFPEPWSVYAEGLACAPQLPAGALLVHDLAHDAALLNSIARRHARHLGVDDGDLRAATSAWSLQYLSALLPPFAAAARLDQGEWVPRQVHRHCCLTHRLPGRRACSACPQKSMDLSPQPSSSSSTAHLTTNENP